MIIKKGSKTLIEIDGGVTSDNAKKLLDAGADVLVAGSFVFKSDNPIKTISNLKTV
jgi:ribulose-phosphate 3-epimerase